MSYGSPAYSVCDKMPWYNDEMENISYDVEKAEEMLDAAGWKKNADGIREKDGGKPFWNFSIRPGIRCVRRWQPIRRSS